MKLRDTYNRHIREVYIVAAVVLFLFGGFIAFLGNQASNPLLIALGFAGLAGGVMLFLAWRRTATTRIDMGPSGQTQAKEEIETLPANSLVISDGLIAFKNIKDAPSQAQKCFNDNVFYNVIREDGDSENLKEFCLPDDDEKKRSYDPAEFANPVTMPSNKRYFTWSASAMQKISVGLMALVIIGEIIGLIVVGG